MDINTKVSEQGTLGLQKISDKLSFLSTQMETNQLKCPIGNQKFS